MTEMERLLDEALYRPPIAIDDASRTLPNEVVALAEDAAGGLLIQFGGEVVSALLEKLGAGTGIIRSDL
ncbi:MAG: hypothetical protein ABSC06_38330 [Rhodopila sp.]|jgi:hypothetical protein